MMIGIGSLALVEDPTWGRGSGSTLLVVVGRLGAITCLAPAEARSRRP
jgi:hypothetical protein